MLLPRRLFLGRRRPFDDAEAPSYLPRHLPKAISTMPALRKLELDGVDCLSAAPEQDLSAAPQPALHSLTLLSMLCEMLSRSNAIALYLWLRWALPAATQLRKLSVTGEGEPSEGLSACLCFHS